MAFIALFLAASVVLLVGSSPGEGFAGYDLGLIEPRDLAGMDGDWLILDARPRSAWSRGHIPGALSFSWEEYTRTDAAGVRYRVLPPDEMASSLGRLGVDETSRVVVYGDADTSWGGEGWVCWVLTRLGHRGPVRLLAGGIAAWKAADLLLATAEEGTSAVPADYTYSLRPEVDISTEEILKNSGSLTLVDVRTTLEWLGGRLPGAIHLSWKDFYTGPDRRPLSPLELAGLLKSHGITGGGQVVYYCTGGVRSAYTWLVHELSGLSHSRNFEGGIEAWKHRGGGGK
jgi:thiosulfate/3-mercaptopyruvate sulfurtransferase